MSKTNYGRTEFAALPEKPSCARLTNGLGEPTKPTMHEAWEQLGRDVRKLGRDIAGELGLYRLVDWLAERLR